jgi:hypothetical protein
MLEFITDSAPGSAGLAELADAMALGAIGRKAVGVQIPYPAPEPFPLAFCIAHLTGLVSSRFGVLEAGLARHGAAHCISRDDVGRSVPLGAS